MNNKMKNAVWDRLSKKYDHLWVQKYSLAPTRKKIIEIVSKLATEPYFRVLDLGCGTGQLIEALERIYPESEFVGIDKSTPMIELAQEKSPKSDFYIADAGELPMYSIPFDFIICSHSFPYYPDKKEVVSRLKNQMQKGGYAIFVQASVNNMYDRIAMWFIEKTAEPAEYLSREQFKRYFAEGFDVIDEFVIKERWYMPNICGFVLRRKQC